MSGGTVPALPPHGRLHGLDALRGFAALWVLLYHIVLRYPRFMLDQQMDTPLRPGFTGPGLLGGGFITAELGRMPVLWFFIISGFVIALTLDRCRGGWDFVVRRASRIYPAYWTAIAIATLLTVLAPLPGASITPLMLVVDLTMIQTYVGVSDIDGVFWSLAVEILFYAYALLFFATGLRRFVPQAALVWALAGLAAAIATQQGLSVSWQLSRLLLLTYGPLLTGGMMLYRLWQGQHRTWSALTLAVCAVAVLFRFHPITALTCLLAAGMIAGSIHRGPAWLAARPLAGLGAISYTLYLSHQTVSFTILATFDAAGWSHGAGMVVAVLTSLLVASLITVVVERPAMAVARHLWRRLRPVEG